MTWRLPLVAGLATLALAGVNLWLAGNPVDISPIKPSRMSAGAETIQAPDSASATVFGELSGTIDRPLFSPTRRKYRPPPIEEAVVPETPAVAPVETSTQTASTDEVPTLFGINIGSGEDAALLRSSSAPNPTWYGKGVDLGGWTIAEIDRDSVTFANGDKREIRKLYDLGGYRAPR